VLSLTSIVLGSCVGNTSVCAKLDHLVEDPSFVNYLIEWVDRFEEEINNPANEKYLLTKESIWNKSRESGDKELIKVSEKAFFSNYPSDAFANYTIRKKFNIKRFPTSGSKSWRATLVASTIKDEKTGVRMLDKNTVESVFFSNGLHDGIVVGLKSSNGKDLLSRRLGGNKKSNRIFVTCSARTD
jgi:hypothetical protein